MKAGIATVDTEFAILVDSGLEAKLNPATIRGGEECGPKMLEEKQGTSTTPVFTITNMARDQLRPIVGAFTQVCSSDVPPERGRERVALIVVDTADMTVMLNVGDMAYGYSARILHILKTELEYIADNPSDYRAISIPMHPDVDTRPDTKAD